MSSARKTLHPSPASILITLIIWSVTAFVAASPVMIAMSVLLVFASALWARVSVKDMLRALKPTAIIMLIALLSNSIIVVGKPEAYLAGVIGVSMSGALRAILTILHIAVVVSYINIVARVLDTQEIASTMSSAIRPLSKLGVPTDELALIIAIALSFMSELFGEFSRIQKAQLARGVQFDSGPMARRLKNYSAILIPLTLATFRRAEALSTAMCDRAFTGSQTRIHKHQAKAIDASLLVVSLIYLVLAYMVR